MQTSQELDFRLITTFKTNLRVVVGENRAKC